MQALNLPGSPDLSTAVSQVPNSLLDAWSTAVSLNVQSEILPRLLTGFLPTGGIWTPLRGRQKSSVTFPFLTTRDQYLAGLKSMRAQLMRHSKPSGIHLQPGADVVVTVRSSIYALVGGCHVPDLVSGPLHSTFADFTNIFMAKANNITEMVHPVIMPFSSQRNADLAFPKDTLKLKQL